jgi:penicillin V acylase-like amidase (Ntn superfamily)
MANEIYKRPAGTGLTPEETAMLEEAEKYTPEYDEDSPKLTPEQLAQFRPVHYASMEERAQAMQNKKKTA